VRLDLEVGDALGGLACEETEGGREGGREGKSE